MKILLHGATNLSNYGDYLFAEIFFNHFLRQGHEVSFYSHPLYGVSDFFCKHLHISPDREHYRQIMKDAHALVYISGSYFVGPAKNDIMSEIRRINRYFAPAESFIRKGKPIYILGVGAGPFRHGLYDHQAKRIMNYATYISVRNEESKDYCLAYGIKNKITVSTDTALIIKDYIRENKSGLPKYCIEGNKKMLLLHIDSDETVIAFIRDTLRNDIITFLSSNRDYQLYLTADGLKNPGLYETYATMFSDQQPVVLQYDDPWKLTCWLERADIIITAKLHVGIIGCALNASVLSFPVVPNKTCRFYRQIGQEDRCIPISQVRAGDALSLLNRYKDERVRITDELIGKAYSNLIRL